MKTLIKLNALVEKIKEAYEIDDTNMSPTVRESVVFDVYYRMGDF